MDINDLKPDMIMTGTVRNVIDFGAFVDIGVHQDGLVHISQICDKYIKHPSEVVSVGDIIDCYVIDINIEKENYRHELKQGQYRDMTKVNKNFKKIGVDADKF